ncbi:MAG: ribbon-helix-helix protein, CopG family [Candidatus Rokuibacteriota bacterium]
MTFRVDPALKAELTRLAAKDDKPLGELLRELARERVERERRREFEAEARRQSLAIAERARDPSTDEHALMRELEAELAEPGDEWKA